jgi:hypothetical protein
LWSSVARPSQRGHYSFWRLLLRGESVSCEQLL